MDAEGRVHGAERLSVLDASIMPDVPSGFTHFPTIMLIAERLSESLVAFVKFGHSRSRSGPLPGHSRGTESRNQEDLGGPGRTRSRQQSNTSGHLRSREDTGGHVTNTVRDREAPGSNPGPPTIFVFRIDLFLTLSGVDGSQPRHNFMGKYRNLGVRW